jgi:glyoxylase-like metal-dependent hydrolase (beta-lactamase superfamily II)
MSQPIIIDTRMHGRDGITAAFVLRGEQTALVETGPKSSIEPVRAGLHDAGIDHIDWIVVTHIHLDHAGAAGTLLADFPDARVAVHTIGAPHLIDPSKLWSSAARIYGDQMDELWGGIDPVPEERIVILEDGDTVDLGGRTLTAFDTPGHARHHHAFLDDATGILFAGDALGVRLPDVGIVRPATPPPEFHLEDAVASIERIRSLGAASLWLTHFGPSSEGKSPLDVEETCDAAIASLRQWEKWVRAGRATSDDLDSITEVVRARARAVLEGQISNEAVDRMEHTTSYRMNTSGYVRYLDKFTES